MEAHRKRASNAPNKVHKCDERRRHKQRQVHSASRCTQKWDKSDRQRAHKPNRHGGATRSTAERPELPRILDEAARAIAQLPPNHHYYPDNIKISGLRRSTRRFQQSGTTGRAAGAPGLWSFSPFPVSTSRDCCISDVGACRADEGAGISRAGRGVGTVRDSCLGGLRCRFHRAPQPAVFCLFDWRGKCRDRANTLGVSRRPAWHWVCCQ